MFSERERGGGEGKPKQTRFRFDSTHQLLHPVHFVPQIAMHDLISPAIDHATARASGSCVRASDCRHCYFCVVLPGRSFAVLFCVVVQQFFFVVFFLICFSNNSCAMGGGGSRSVPLEVRLICQPDDYLL